MKGRRAVGVGEVWRRSLGECVGEAHRATEPDDFVQDRRELRAAGGQLNAAARVGACVNQGDDDAGAERPHAIPKWCCATRIDRIGLGAPREQLDDFGASAAGAVEQVENLIG